MLKDLINEYTNLINYVALLHMISYQFFIKFLDRTNYGMTIKKVSLLSS